MSLGTNRQNKPHIDIKAVSASALRTLPELLQDWLPGGRREGHEYLALNPNRADTRLGSFKVNVSSGCWSDFATGDQGGDAVSLYAFVKGTSQVEAARRVADQIGMASTVAGLANVAGVKDKTEAWRPLLPVPADAPKIDSQ